MTTRPVYREQLDQMGCGTPGCDCTDGPLHLHGKCHPTSPTTTAYVGGDIVVSCYVCEKEIGRFPVASKPSSPQSFSTN